MKPRTLYACIAVHEFPAQAMLRLRPELRAEPCAVLDGTPPLPREWQREWAQDFQEAYDAFCQRVDAGKRTRIDAYAAEAPEEFFAVVSEYHFSAPGVLAEAMPKVAAHLRRYYGPSPFEGRA